VVTDVQGGSPANGAGLAVGDIVLEVDGTTVQGEAGLIAIIRDARPGDMVTILIERGGERLTVTATLSQRPEG
jgi:S1-C subfamily serine protease